MILALSQNGLIHVAPLDSYPSSIARVCLRTEDGRRLAHRFFSVKWL